MVLEAVVVPQGAYGDVAAHEFQIPVPLIAEPEAKDGRPTRCAVGLSTGGAFETLGSGLALPPFLAAACYAAVDAVSVLQPGRTGLHLNVGGFVL